jgi:hypothetical protein
MPQDRGCVREVAWREVLPWLLLVRAFRVSIQVWQITLGTLGLSFTIFGWWLLAGVFSGSREPLLIDSINSYQSHPWSQPQDERPDFMPDVGAMRPEATASPQQPSLGRPPDNPFLGPWRQLQAPFRQIFDVGLGFTGLAFLISCGLWAIAVWGIFGGALTRRAAMQLGREESIGIKAALGFAISKWRSYFAAPLLPMIGILICSVPMLVMGLLMRFDFGVTLGGVIWPLMLIGGLCVAMLLLVLVFGWPLMWPTISTEGQDSFDALSRPWSYVYHRPLHYLFYAIMAALLGGLGWYFVFYFAEWVRYLPKWVVAWGAGQEHAAKIFPNIFPQFNAAPLQPPGISPWGARSIAFWDGCVRLVTLGFAYSYFWTASTAIYLLLRRDEDGTEFDDVHVESEAAHGLPALEKDAAGVPTAPKHEPAATAEPAPAPAADGTSG